MRIVLLAPLIALATGGCIVGSVAKGAVDLAILPVKAVSSGVDAVTTSQSEADQKRGRQLRLEDERRAREEQAMRRRCDSGRPAPEDICPAPMPR